MVEGFLFRIPVSMVALFMAWAVVAPVCEAQDTRHKISLPFIEVPQLSGTEVEGSGASTLIADILSGRVTVDKNAIHYQIEDENSLRVPSRFDEEFLVNGSKALLEPRGVEPQITQVSTFVGDRSQHLSARATYSHIELGQVWDGITVRLAALPHNLEKLFFVAPGSNPATISLLMRRAHKLEINAKGELVAHGEGGLIAFSRPLAYQSSLDGKSPRTEVEIAYELRADLSYGFKVGDYDRNQELVIDPLIASTYLGGAGDEHFSFDDPGGHLFTGHRSMVKDGLQNIYVVSQTRSNPFPLPGSPVPYDSSYNDTNAVLKNDVVVFKFNSGLDQLLAATYLGGSSQDDGVSLAIDGAGNVVVVGTTRSVDFPVTAGVLDHSFNGDIDVFVAKLNSNLSTLLAATFMGGTDTDKVYSTIIAPDSRIYIAGDTLSVDFPALEGMWDMTHNGGWDGYVAALSSDLKHLELATFLGGASNDFIRQISFNLSGRVVILGNTESADFPVNSGSYDSSFNNVGPGSDAFIAVMSSELFSIKSATFLGGNDNEYAQAFDFDYWGNIVVAGTTISTNFPVSPGAFQSARIGSAHDVFISRLNPNLTVLQASTYYGGTQNERAYDIVVDRDNFIFVVGETNSNDLVTYVDAYSRTLGGTADGFVAKLGWGLSTLSQATYFGGTGNVDKVTSLLVDLSGNIVLSGITTSNDIPTSASAYQNTSGGGQDQFVSILTPNLLRDHPAHQLLVRDTSGNASVNLLAGDSVAVRVTVQNDLGQTVTDYSGPLAVTFTGPGVPHKKNVPYCLDRNSSQIAIGTPTSLNFIAGEATTTCRVFRAESAHLDAALTATIRSHDDESLDLDLNVGFAPFSAAGSYIDVNPVPASVVAQVNVSVTAADAYGNAVGAATGANRIVGIAVTGANPRTLTTVDNSDGTYSTSYMPSTSGYDSVAGTISNQGGGGLQALGNDSDGVNDGVFHLTVYDLGLDHYEVRFQLAPGIYTDHLTMTAGTTATISIIAADPLGNPVMDYDTVLYNMRIFGPTPSPYGNVPVWGAIVPFGSSYPYSFVDGKSSTTITVYNREVVHVDATSTDGAWNSNASDSYDLDLTVLASNITHFTISGTSEQIAGTSQNVTIRARDAYGNINPSYIDHHNITFSGASVSYNGNAPTAVDSAAQPVIFGLATDLNFLEGIATSQMTLYARQSAEIEVSDGTFNTFASPNYDLNVDVRSQGVWDMTKSELYANPNPIGNCGDVGVWVITRDSFGNQLENGGAVVSTTVTGGNVAVVEMSDLGNGSYYGKYSPLVVGVDQIQGTINGEAIQRDLDWQDQPTQGYLSDGIYHEHVEAAVDTVATWVGTFNTNWFDFRNWSGGVVPEICYKVVIDGLYTFAPTIDHTLGPVRVRKLRVGETRASVLTQASASDANKIIVGEDAIFGANATFTHSPNTSSKTHSMIMTVTGNLTVSAGAKFDIQGKGYEKSYGPGAGGSCYPSGHGGGAHGGNGGPAHCGGFGIAYDSVVAPLDLGSGGTSGSSGVGGQGGGYLRLVVGQDFLLDGSIIASGADTTFDYSGGGGGGVWITTHNLAGSGLINADGSKNLNGGIGGGGGRVAIYYDDNTTFDFNRITAYGWGPSYGGAGTIYLRDNDDAYGRLKADNGDKPTQAETPLSGVSLTVQQLTVQNYAHLRLSTGSSLQLTDSSMATTSNASLLIDAGTSFVSDNLTTLNNFVVTQNGTTSFSAIALFSGVTYVNNATLDLPSIANIQTSTVTNNGYYNHSGTTLAVNQGTLWIENGLKPNIGNSVEISDLIVENGTLEFRNQNTSKGATYDTVEVRAGGVLTHTINGSVSTYSVNLDVTTMTVATGGLIDVSRKGYSTAVGPGAGTSGLSPGGGAHGGNGGNGPLTGGSAYGSITQPITIGSGGGAYSTYSSYGGGSIELIADNLLLDGSILANGESTSGSGGASGGSVYLEATTIAGLGNIAANGGSSNSGGGGGGRIAIYYNDATSFNLNSIAAYGAWTSGSYQVGGAGTVFLKQDSATFGTLRVNNNGRAGAQTPQPSGSSLSLAALSISGGAQFVVPLGASLTMVSGSTISGAFDSGLTVYGRLYLPTASYTLQPAGGLNIYNYGDILGVSNLTVNNAYLVIGGSFSPALEILEIQNGATVDYYNTNDTVSESLTSLVIKSGGVLTHRSNGSSQTNILNLALDNLTVEAGGQINVQGRGYAAGEGTGQGGDNGTTSGGAGHGGLGSPSSACATCGGGTYGRIKQPVTVGAGGGLYAGAGSAGGGAIVLNVAQTAMIDGTLNARGADFSNVQRGGGAGGSVYLTTRFINGGGVIDVGGGAGGPGAGGGGGGRLALYYETNLGFNTANLRAFGGTGWNWGGAGTIFVRDTTLPALGDLTIDNNTHLGRGTPFSNFNEKVHNTFVRNGGVLRLTPGIAFTSEILDVQLAGQTIFDTFSNNDFFYVDQVYVRTGGLITHSANTNVASNEVALSVRNMTIEAGGSITTNFLGYGAGYGPGSTLINGGAGYGGNGGNGSGGIGGSAYGTIYAPVDLGSGAALGGGSGGGNIRIVADEVLTVNGDLLALGQSSSLANEGGGAGGSVLLSADTLAGSGFISANGGNGLGNGGGGAGGRIALLYSHQTFLTDGGHITLPNPSTYDLPIGGTGLNGGSLGTLYFSQPDHYIVSGDSTQIAGRQQTITITLIDNNGNPFYYTGYRQIELSGASSAPNGVLPTCTDYQGNPVALGNATTLLFVAGHTTCSLLLYKEELAEIDVDDGVYVGINSRGDPSWDLNIDVGDSDLASGSNSVLSASHTTVVVGNPVTVVATIYDMWEQRINIGGKIVELRVAGANPQMLLVTDNHDGTYSGVYTPLVSGEDRFTGKIQGDPIEHDTDGLSDGVFHLSAIERAPDHLEVTGASTQMAGVGQSITIWARDEYGNIANGFTGLQNVIISGPATSALGVVPTCEDQTGTATELGQPTSLLFNAGTAHCELVLYNVEQAHVDAAIGSLSSAGDDDWDLDVSVFANINNRQARITALPNPAEKGFLVTIHLNTLDIFGNPLAVGGALIQLGVSGANSATPVVGDLGDGSYEADYLAQHDGTDFITGTINGVAILYDEDATSDGTYHEVINAPVVPTHLEVTGLNSQISGTTQTITITAMNDVGQRAFSYEGYKTLVFSGPRASPLGHFPNCVDWIGVARPLGSGTQVSFVQGVATCSMRLYRSEQVSVDVTDGLLDSTGDPSYDLDVDVSALPVRADYSNLDVLANPLALADPAVVSVVARDIYGNAWGNSSVIEATITGPENSIVQLIAQGNGLYSANFVPSSPGDYAVTATLDGSQVTSDSDGVVDGVFHLSVRVPITPTHYEITGSGAQLSGSSQEIVIWAKNDAGEVGWNYRGDKVIKLSGAALAVDGTAPTCTDKYGVAIDFGQEMTVDFVSGKAICALKLYLVEKAEVDAAAGVLESLQIDSAGSPAYGLSVSVVASVTDVTRTVLEVSPNPISTYGEVSVSVNTYDRYGNGSTNPDSVLFQVRGANSLSIFVAGDSGGLRAKYIPTSGGTDVITGTINGVEISRDNDGVNDGSYHLTVVATALATHLEVKGNAAQNAGDVQSIEISARENGGVNVVSYTGEKSIYLSGANAAPDGMKPGCKDIYGKFVPFGQPTVLSFVDGVSNCELALFRAEDAMINVSDRTINSYAEPEYGLNIKVASDTSGQTLSGSIGASKNPVTVGEATWLEIEIVETYGNLVSVPIGDLELSVDGKKLTNGTISAVSPGKYHISYQSASSGIRLVTGKIRGVAIHDDSDGVSDGTYNLSVYRLTPPLYSISGVASFNNYSKGPAAGVLVTDGSRYAYTGADGSYTIADVPAGTYTITGTLENYVVSAQSGINPVKVVNSNVTGRNLVVDSELPVKLYATWNGFLGNVVIVEMFNTGVKDLRVKLELFPMEGSKRDVSLGHLEYRIPPGAERDVVVNDMIGFAVDRYGVLRISLSNDTYNGQVSYYKLAPGGAFRTVDTANDDFDYALPNSLDVPVTGTSALLYNTSQPSTNAEEQSYLVPNWLTIVNANETKETRFRVRRYLANGKRVSIPNSTGLIPQLCQLDHDDVICRVGAMGRVDIDGGHVYPGPKNFGIVEVIPEDTASPYVASLVRYGASAPPDVFSSRYKFGVYLKGVQAGAEEQVLLVSNAGAFDNWVELANILDSSVTVTVKLTDYSGKAISNSSVSLGAKSERHLPISQMLPRGGYGALRLSANKPKSLLALNMYYARDSQGRIETAMGVQGDSLSQEVRLTGTYNLFLGMQDWLKVVNLGGESASLKLEVVDSTGTRNYPIRLGAWSGMDIPLHDSSRFGLQPNTLGMFSIKGNDRRQVFAEVRRIKPGGAVAYDFLMGSKVR